MVDMFVAGPGDIIAAGVDRFLDRLAVAVGELPVVSLSWKRRVAAGALAVVGFGGIMFASAASALAFWRQVASARRRRSASVSSHGFSPLLKGALLPVAAHVARALATPEAEQDAIFLGADQEGWAVRQIDEMAPFRRSRRCRRRCVRCRAACRRVRAASRRSTGHNHPGSREAGPNASSVDQLHRDRRGFAAADAQRGDAALLALGLERADQRDDQARAAGADRDGRARSRRRGR